MGIHCFVVVVLVVLVCLLNTILKVVRHLDILDMHGILDETKAIHQPIRSTPILVIPDAKDNLIQIIVSSPEPGIIAAIGSFDRLSPSLCPTVAQELIQHKEVKHQAIKRRNLHHDGNIFLYYGDIKVVAKNVTNLFLASGPFALFFFNVTVATWEKWQTTSPMAPMELIIEDLVQDRNYSLELLVDPLLQQLVREPHFLSATTTIRKNHKYYHGSGEMKPDAPVQNWDNEQIVARLGLWLAHHRSLGVSHFYIVDNHPNANASNLVPHGTDITYIRAPYIQYDYDSQLQLCGRNITLLTFSGQLMLENAVLRMAHTQWLWSADLDEFIVLHDKYKSRLTNLIDHYSHSLCMNQTPVTCQTSLQESQQIRSIDLYPTFIDKHNKRRWSVEFQRKVLMQPAMIQWLSVHYTNGYHDTDLPTGVLPNDAWLAHLSRVPVIATETLLTTLSNHTAHMTESVNTFLP